MEYFQREKPEPDFLLAAAQATDDAAHLVVRRRRNGFLVMNRYPYAAGHLMAVPYRQVGDTAALSDAEKLDLFALAEEAQAVLRATIRARASTSDSTSARAPARASPTTCTCTSSRAGRPT